MSIQGDNSEKNDVNLSNTEVSKATASSTLAPVGLLADNQAPEG